MSGTDKANDLLAQIPRGEERGLPPVYLWNPPFCGDIDMRIARDGGWFYLDTSIGRKPMVKLFSSIIRHDGDDYFLATPTERVGICVDDAPFVTVTLQMQGEGGAQMLRLAANVEDEIEADVRHPLRVETDPHAQKPTPHLRVRGSLGALAHRNVFYQLVELAVPCRANDVEWFGVWSHDELFPIGPQPD